MTKRNLASSRCHTKYLLPILVSALTFHGLAEPSVAQQNPSVSDEVITGAEGLGSSYIYEGALALGQKVEELQNAHPDKKISIEIVSKKVKERKRGTFTARQMVYTIRVTIS